MAVIFRVAAAAAAKLKSSPKAQMNTPGIHMVMRPSKEVLDLKLSKRRRELKDMRTPHRQAAVFLDRWVQKNFQVEGGNVGGWPPFALGGRLMPDGTIDASAKLLQDTGRLRLSFLPFATKKSAGIGSVIPYSARHQAGEPVRNLPARPMIPEEGKPGFEQVRKGLFKIYDRRIHVLTTVKPVI